MTPCGERCEEALRRLSGGRHPLLGPLARHRGRERPVFDYRFEHTLATVKIARWLAPLAGADPDALECAAWLHDCGSASRIPGQGPPRPGGHRRGGADPRRHGLPRGEDPRGAPRHRAPRGPQALRRLEPVETACLWDADKLSKIGAASIVHYHCIAGGFRPVEHRGHPRPGRALAGPGPHASPPA